jgi:hypothetical protein
MTMAEIRASDKDMLIPTDINKILGCDAHTIRLQAREFPESLGFNVVVIGNRTLIPRKAFLRFMGEAVVDL